MDLLAEDFWAVVATPRAGREDCAIADEKPKSARIRASKSIFNVGRGFIVLLSSEVIPSKSKIFECRAFGLIDRQLAHGVT